MLFGSVVLFEEETGTEPCAFGPMTMAESAKRNGKKAGGLHVLLLHAP